MITECSRLDTTKQLQGYYIIILFLNDILFPIRFVLNVVLMPINRLVLVVVKISQPFSIKGYSITIFMICKFVVRILIAFGKENWENFIDTSATSANMLQRNADMDVVNTTIVILYNFMSRKNVLIDPSKKRWKRRDYLQQ